MADVDACVAKCVKCAQHKGTVPRPAPILEYPPPDRPWDVVSIDLLQLPASHQGYRYLLVCVDHLSRYVVFAPVKDKSAQFCRLLGRGRWRRCRAESVAHVEESAIRTLRHSISATKAQHALVPGSMASRHTHSQTVIYILHIYITRLCVVLK